MSKKIYSGKVELERNIYQFAKKQSALTFKACFMRAIADIHRRAFSHSKEAVLENKKRATERFAEKFLKA